MKRKGLILVLIALFTLVLFGANRSADAAVGDWELVTDAALLEVGDEIVIVASGSNHALGTTQNSNNRKAEEITKSSDKKTVTINENIQIITLESGTKAGTFAFNVGDGYLYAASSSKNYLRTETKLSANSSWKITVADGVATIEAQGANTRNVLRKNSSDALFSCYSSGQNDVSIYKKATEDTSTQPSVTITSSPSSRMLVGTEFSLTFDCTNCSSSDVTWLSDNQNVATVTNEGKITAVAAGGPVTITAYVNDEAVASCQVTVYSYASDLQSLVNTYYNNGVYTKKTEIYLTQDAKDEVVQYFHGNVDTARTTYYNGEYLLMANFDGTLAEVNEKNQPVNGINSGYRTEGEDMKHFVYKNGEVVDTYTVSGTSIADYYIALDDMIEEGFFSKWNLDEEGKYVYNVSKLEFDEENNPIVDEMLHNFLWFAAPCLEDSVFGNPDGTYYIMADGIQLVVDEKENEYYGSYLSLQIVLAGDDVTKSTNGILAEARVYKENKVFNDLVKPSEILLNNAKDTLLKNYNDKKINGDLSLQKEITAYADSYKETLDITWTKNGESISKIEYTSPTADTIIDLVATITVTETINGETVKTTREVNIQITLLKKVSGVTVTVKSDNSGEYVEFDNCSDNNNPTDYASKVSLDSNLFSMYFTQGECNEANAVARFNKSNYIQLYKYGTLSITGKDLTIKSVVITLSESKEITVNQVKYSANTTFAIDINSSSLEIYNALGSQIKIKTIQITYEVN